MATSYEDVFNRFKNKITDTDFYQLKEGDQTELMTMHLNSAIGNIELDDLKIINSLDRDDDMEEFDNDLTNAEIEIIAQYMLVSWYDQKINSVEKMSMYVGTKDEKFTNQRELLRTLIDNRELYRKKARKHYMEYNAKHNSYLEGR